MKIALLGYGKMGQLVEEEAHAKGHKIIARFSRQLGTLQERKDELNQADLAIDFSQTASVLPHLKICLELNKPIVIGTTGWDEQLHIAQEMVIKSNGSCLYAPNFSIGVYLFQQIANYAASLLQPFQEYDVAGIEYHHREKLDKPSGTAKALSRNLLKHMPRINDLHFSSVRCGHIPGTHTLHFDSQFDALTLTHEARNRQGFAQGAIAAAEWLLPRQGFFSIDEMMQSINSTLRSQSPCN